jgi:hypothetical protein
MASWPWKNMLQMNMARIWWNTWHAKIIYRVEMVINGKNVSIGFFSCLQPFFICLELWKFTKKCNSIKMGFIEYLVLMIDKGYMPLFIVESPWLKWIMLHFVIDDNFLFINNLFMNTFLFYRKPWKFTCFLPLVNVQLWQQCLGYQFH